MTATERMVRPLLKRNAEESGKVIFSMDDENVYGPLFSKYNFGDAIKDKTISDYKIIVAGVKESEVYNYIAENKHLKVEDLDEDMKPAKKYIKHSNGCKWLGIKPYDYVIGWYALGRQNHRTYILSSYVIYMMD